MKIDFEALQANAHTQQNLADPGFPVLSLFATGRFFLAAGR